MKTHTLSRVRAERPIPLARKGKPTTSHMLASVSVANIRSEQVTIVIISLLRWVPVDNPLLWRARRRALQRKAPRKVARAREERKLWREREQESRVMDVSSIEFWSKFIQMLVFPAERWASWIPSSMISSNELLAKHHDLLTITRGKRSPHARSRRLFDFSFLVSLQSMLSVKVLRQ